MKSAVLYSHSATTKQMLVIILKVAVLYPVTRVQSGEECSALQSFGYNETNVGYYTQSGCALSSD